MAEFTLGVWIVTALIGGWMWLTVSDAGRQESSARASRLPPLLLFVHPLLGLAGVVVWIAYLSSDAAALTWVALGELLVGAAIGDVLAARTLRHRREDEAHLTSVEARARDMEPWLATQTVAEVATVEQRLPVSVIALHGAFALTTIALVLATAIGTI